MSSIDSSGQTNETASSTSRRPASEANFAQPARRIAEYVDRPDFPQCVLGEHVEIGGVLGCVVEIVRQSLKVKSPEGTVQSFNCNRLRTIYGARPEHAADTKRSESGAASESGGSPGPTASASRLVTDGVAPEPPPRRDFIADPDFSAAIQPISAFAGRADFPKCVYGAHIDIVGHVGVVVELVKDSVKVQSQSGPVRSFNAPMLRKLYGAG